MRDQGIGQWATRRALLEGDRVALESHSRRVSYIEFDQRTNLVANGLYREGVRFGDRVAMLLFNSVEFMEVLFGCAKLGAIAVPINFRLSADEVSYLLADSGAVLLVVSSRLEAVASKAAGASGVHVRRLYVVGEIQGEPSDLQRPFEELLAGASEHPRDEEVTLDDTAMLMYTSGTTGRPKGAMLTHGNMLWNAVNLVGRLSGLSHDDRTVTAAPLFHIGGLGVFSLPLFYLGATNYLLESFSPLETIELMAQKGATCMFLVPAMWAAIAKVPDFASYDLSGLRFGISGGAPCPLTVIEFFLDKRVNFLEGFGMTETSPLVSVLASADVKTKAGSIGRVCMHVDARIVDDEDHDCATGEVGELALRGPNIFKGYWGLPSATAEAMKHGWFHTGDLGKIDSEGFITLVDRKKDMIITGGENVYPIEVEQVLFRHPEIQDVAIIGAKDERWGETVVAVVVLAKADAIDEAEVISFARERLAHFKVPRRVEFIDELPRNATGKILKRDLRLRFSGESAAVSR